MIVYRFMCSVVIFCLIYVARADYSVLIGVSQPFKRKNGYHNNEVESSEWTASPVYSDIANSPFRTPVSAKGRVNGRSKATKNNRSVPSTPISNVGETFSPIHVIV